MGLTRSDSGLPSRQTSAPTIATQMLELLAREILSQKSGTSPGSFPVFPKSKPLDFDSGSVDSVRAIPPDKALSRGIQGVQLLHPGNRTERFSLGKLCIALSRNGKDEGIRGWVCKGRPASRVVYASLLP